MLDISWVEVLILIALVVLIGLVAVAAFRRRQSGIEAAHAGQEVVAGAERDAQQLRTDAEQLRADADTYQRDTRGRADELLREAQATRNQADEEVRARRGELRSARQELDRREQRITERETRLDDESRNMHERAQRLDELESDLAARSDELSVAEAAHTQELERVAGLTQDQAKTELVATVEHEAKRQAVLVARDIESAARRDAEDRARDIVVGAIQRIASDQTSESVVTAVHLPGDDMKGRIIGREGRNIRSFEQVTGVNVLIDDTPESVLLSSFDPVRRETARITLVELIADGRIHPARIEEVHERSKAKINERVLRAAEDAMAEVGISDVHPDLVPVIGALRYRTSYGQNVLKHLVESAHIAGLMAAELHLDVATCKRAAFLHDIGKALTHEVEGSHALIGADLARKFGEHPDIVHAIEAHHNEVEPQTVEAVLTQAADAISGGRPGARRESLEAYVKRLERLEEIALAHDGVEKVFAMQAGREVRVMVAPDVIDDIEAQVLARDIAKQVEEELTYPGQIKVSVIRESRAVETAR
ncbi:ribonuclease Y [Microlunatus elymi]|uniref:Ribonuclease Y n=1 Tax=Microlunatus elymi TaxID=2596828 RepID=A0A516Q164_9ACTN|nr:ribonuclease Y [Microlunatus elymi]QDP97175.1 ribonuclease Y [Microlunatus elymi]